MDKFKLLQDLGGGGFGRTYKTSVQDQELKGKWGEIVVLKIPHNKGKEKILIEELIKYEILFQTISPEHIVRYLGFELFRDQYVMVMEFVDGYDLSKLLEDRGKLTIEEVIDLSEQICCGLAEAHKARIFHRDIKPSNILFDAKSKKAKITDFGISRLLQTEKDAPTVIGTLAYMAPEVISGRGGFYSDLYSLSVTMYQMLTGELPIVANSIEELVRNTQTVIPKPPILLRPDTPQQLSDLIIRGLEKDIDKRFRTVEEMLSAIRNCKGGEDIRLAIDKAWEVFRGGDVKKAEEEFRKILHAFPGKAESYLALGEFYNRCERYQFSLRALKKGLELGEQPGLFNWNLGLVYKQLGKDSEALTALRQAISAGIDQKMRAQSEVLISLWSKSS